MCCRAAALREASASSVGTSEPMIRPPRTKTFAEFLATSAKDTCKQLKPLLPASSAAKCSPARMVWLIDAMTSSMTARSSGAGRIPALISASKRDDASSSSSLFIRLYVRSNQRSECADHLRIHVRSCISDAPRDERALKLAVRLCCLLRDGELSSREM